MDTLARPVYIERVTPPLLPNACIAVRFDNDADWLAWRAEEDAVGGSEVPRLLGLHPFKDAPYRASTDAGHTLEPLVLARAARVRRWARVEQGWCVRAADEPWRRGSLDALVFNLHEDEARLVAEVKVVFLGQAHLWREGLPDHVLLQALWYMAITGLPVVVIALLVPAWGIGDQDPALVAECFEIRFYELTPEAHGARAALVVEAVRQVRAGKLQPAPYSPPLPAGPEQGTMEDGELVASWAAAREAVLGAVAALRAARQVRLETAARFNALSTRLRSRVGLGGSMLAGGWRVSVGKNGAIKVR